MNLKEQPIDYYLVNSIHVDREALKSLDETIQKYFQNLQDEFKIVNSSSSFDTNNVWSPLHYAIKFEDKKMLNSFKFSAPLLGLKNVEGDTPLHLAAKMKKFSLIKEILSSLYDLKDSTNNDGLTHLHIASLSDNGTIIERLIGNGISIDSQVNKDARLWPGYTALHFAVDYGCLCSVRTLLNYDANIYAKNSLNLTPLHLAFRRQSDRIINTIVSKNGWIVKENSIDEFGLTHFHIACMENDNILVPQLIDNGIDLNQSINSNSPLFSGYTPLHLAVQFGQLHATKILLINGANVDAVDPNGLTPLHLACQLNTDKLNRIIRLASKSLNPSINCDDELKVFDFKNLPFKQWLSNYNTFDNIIRMLILFKSQINYQDHIGRTALFHSLEMNSTSLETFIESFDGATSMTIRDWIYKKRKDFVEILLEDNANPNIRNFYDEMIMQNFMSDETLISNEHMTSVIELLIKHKWQIKDEFKEHLLRYAIRIECYNIFKYLFDERTNVNYLDNDLNTLLHLTYKNNSNLIINALLENGAITNAKNREGYTFLHLAMNKSGVPIYTPLSTIESRSPRIEIASNSFRCDRDDGSLIGFSVLIRTNFNILNNKPVENMDDFFKFCDLGNNTCHSYLLSDYRNINCQDSKGETPLHLACKNLNYRNIKILLAYGADINITNNQGFSPAKYIIAERSNCPVEFCFPTVRNHLNLLVIFGLPISEYNKMMLDEIIKTFSNFNDIEERSKKEFPIKCKSELDKSLAKKINNHEVLYDVLFSHENHLADLTTNRVFVETITSLTFKQMYPISDFLFKLQFRKGLIRRELIEPAKTAVKLLFSNTRFPDSIILEIFAYLKNADLENLIKSLNRDFRLQVVERKNHLGLRYAMLKCLKL